VEGIMRSESAAVGNAPPSAIFAEYPSNALANSQYLFGTQIVASGIATTMVFHIGALMRLNKPGCL
jgi:hypothetical protein